MSGGVASHGCMAALADCAKRACLAGADVGPAFFGIGPKTTGWMALDPHNSYAYMAHLRLFTLHSLTVISDYHESPFCTERLLEEASFVRYLFLTHLVPVSIWLKAATRVILSVRLVGLLHLALCLRLPFASNL